MNRVLPKVYGHNLSLSVEGVGSNNNKEYCKCDKCQKLRERCNRIFNKPHHKIRRWCNKN